MRDSKLNTVGILLGGGGAKGLGHISMLKVDRWEVVFDRGAIIPAVAASFALPGIFKPVVRDGRVLVDGGSVGPVPYNLLFDDCEIVVAIDAADSRSAGAGQPQYESTPPLGGVARTKAHHP
jgi:predicted acylesterase/phospholipase RssA